MKYQHSKKCTDKRRRDFYLFFLDDRLILRQKSPWKEGYDYGYDGKNSIVEAFYKDGSIHQKRREGVRRCGEKYTPVDREVRFPVSQRILKELNIPKDSLIPLTSRI